MKKILLFLLLVFPIVAKAQLELPFSIKLVNSAPIDFWYFESDGTPYDNTGEVTTQVLSAIRYIGQTFNVNGVEYWFKDGITDGDLIAKGGSSLTLVNGNGTTVNGTGDGVDLGGTLTGNVAIDGGGVYNVAFGTGGPANIGRFDVYTNDNIYMRSYNTSNYPIEIYGGDVPLLFNNGTGNKWIETSILKIGVDLRIDNPTNNFRYIINGAAIVADRTVTLPLLTGNDTFVTANFNQALTNKSVNGVTLVNGGTSTKYLSEDGTYTTPSGGGGGLTVGTSTITSGTNTKVLYNNSGVLGEYTVSGTGNVALTTSPTFTTPNIGTATGTASGNYSLASGGTATGTNTFAMGSNPFILTSGVTTGTGATAGIQNVFNSLTTGNGLDISSSSVSSGAIVKITGTGTAAASSTQKGLWVAVSGANATSSQTTYGSYITNSHTGTGSNNIGLYVSASGGTYNTAGIIDGNLLVGTTSGGARVEIRGVDATSTNYAIAAKNSSGVRTFSVLNDGSVKVPLGDLTLGGGATASKFIFLEPSGSGTNYSSFKAVAQSADINYSLPPTVAVAGAVLTDVAGNGVLTWEEKSLQSATNTKTEKVIYNVGTIGSAATSTYSIHAESYYANGTTLLAKITVVAVKTDGSASAHSTVTARFRKNSSGTWSVDDAGTDITSDITILADVVGDFSTNPNVKVTMGAASGNYNVSWVAETIEVK